MPLIKTAPAMANAEGLLANIEAAVKEESSSVASVNYRHIRIQGNIDRVSSSSVGNVRNIHSDIDLDMDPHLVSDTSDTQEQSGHTLPDYRRSNINSGLDIPSPAREETDEEAGISIHDIQATYPSAWENISDPAELEWMIHNARTIEEEGEVNDALNEAIDDNAINEAIFNCSFERIATATHGEVSAEGSKTNADLWIDEVNNGDDSVAMDTEANDIEVTPSKSAKTEVRRSARITNRDGPVDTRARYTIAAKMKGLELPAEGAKERTGISIERMALLQDEDWERVAEGSGYIISPSKKENAGAFIKSASSHLA